MVKAATKFSDTYPSTEMLLVCHPHESVYHNICVYSQIHRETAYLYTSTIRSLNGNSFILLGMGVTLLLWVRNAVENYYDMQNNRQNKTQSHSTALRIHIRIIESVSVYIFEWKHW